MSISDAIASCLVTSMSVDLVTCWPLQEAVRWLLSGRSMFDAKSGMTDYNYSGSNRWSGRERQQFRRAWKVHRKQFNMLKSSVRPKEVWRGEKGACGCMERRCCLES